MKTRITCLLAMAVLVGCSAAQREGAGPAGKMKEFIAGVQLFEGLSSAEMDQVAALCTQTEYPRGAHVIRTGEPVKHLYVIWDGKADVLVNGRAVATLGPNGLLGEMSFVDGQPPSADVVMVTDGKLILIDRAGLQRVMDEQPRLGLKVMRNMAAILSQKLHQMNQQATRSAILVPTSPPPTPMP